MSTFIFDALNFDHCFRFWTLWEAMWKTSKKLKQFNPLLVFFSPSLTISTILSTWVEEKQINIISTIQQCSQLHVSMREESTCIFGFLPLIYTFGLFFITNQWLTFNESKLDQYFCVQIKFYKLTIKVGPFYSSRKSSGKIQSHTKLQRMRNCRSNQNFIISNIFPILPDQIKKLK